MFFLTSNVVFVICGRVFEKCADGVSQKRKRNLLRPLIYNPGPSADDLMTIFGHFQLFDFQCPAEGQNYV